MNAGLICSIFFSSSNDVLSEVFLIRFGLGFCSRSMFSKWDLDLFFFCWECFAEYHYNIPMLILVMNLARIYA